jgi:hypothetical protein
MSAPSNTVSPAFFGRIRMVLPVVFVFLIGCRTGFGNVNPRKAEMPARSVWSGWFGAVT